MDPVTYRVIVRRVFPAAFLGSGVSHALHCAFAETDAHAGGVVGVIFPNIGNYLDPALHLKAEIDTNKSVFFQHAGFSAFKRRLRGRRVEKRLGLFRGAGQQYFFRIDVIDYPVVTVIL